MALTQVKTLGIADDAVTLAKQAGGTDGQIITFDASGNPTAVGPGTDGQVLTSTGSGSPPAFEDAAGGPSLANDSNNRVITGTGSGLNGEANLTFDGSVLQVDGDIQGEGNDGTANNLKWDKSDDTLYFRDSVLASFGTGGDLDIYHNGTNSYINNATGALAITGDDLNFENAARNETYAEMDSNGAVKLYYDNSKKFETKSGGADVHGTLGVKGIEGGAATINLWADEGDDAPDKWRLLASESANTFTISSIPDGGSWETSIECNGDGNVELYHNNAKKLSTRADGIEVHAAEGGNAEFRLVADEGDDGGDYWRLQSKASDNTFNLASYSSGSWVDKVSATTGGNLSIADGDLVIGTSGHGISFAATSDGTTMSSELLDDYEEGGFDATCNNSVTLHSNMNRCNYTRIGRLCVVTGEVQVNNDNSNANLEISNLPFAVDAGTDSGSNAAGAVITYSHNFEENYGIKCMATEGSNALKFKELRDDNSYVDAKADTGGYICFSISYFIE